MTSSTILRITVHAVDCKFFKMNFVEKCFQVDSYGNNAISISSCTEMTQPGHYNIYDDKFGTVYVALVSYIFLN